MGRVSACVWLLLQINIIVCIDSDYELRRYLNQTDPATKQIYLFKLQHPKPIGILTTSTGKLVEIRETNVLNSDPFANQYHVDLITHNTAERIPERIVHAKGTAAFGYFEVTHDVSKYIKTEMFNGIGKRTPAVGRFSTAVQNLGGNDLAREVKGLSVKFYTQEGNLDLLCLNLPVYFYRNAIDFSNFVHAVRRNPKTYLFENTLRWDFITKEPDNLHAFLWLFSDYGIPNGYRKMDIFPIHTYEVHNKYGDIYFVKFNFRSEQGLENIPSDVAAEISSRDPDYYNRDLYNSIENKTYPSWRLEMDIMTFNDVKKVDYNPFEITRIWKKGDYFTVPIGRLVFDRNPDNYFRVAEQSAFNPGNLVPGIPGPIDTMFKARRSAYRETQIYRLGVNHNKIRVNKPLYYKGYERDGVPPLGDNMRDAPNYYPNSFNGPVPYVDSSQPKERFSMYETNAVDLDAPAYFYNYVLRNDGERERLANNTVAYLYDVSPELQRKVIRLYTLTDPDLGRRLERVLEKVLKKPPPPVTPSRLLRVPTKTYIEGNQIYHKTQEKHNVFH